MMSTIKHYMQSFIPHHMRREVKELYLSTLILNFGIMMIQLFEPIYLHKIGLTLHQIVVYYLIVYVVYFFTLPLGASFAKKVGYEKSIVASTVVFIVYYLTFYSIATVPWLFYVAPLLFALQKILYWPAFNADFARFARKDEDGREISGINSIVLFTSVLAPLAAGFILKFWGFGALFTFASLLFILSNIPLLTTKEAFVPQPFPYLDAYKNLFAKKNRRRMFAYIGYGEELIVLVVWPIFMSIVIVDLLNVGAIVSAATLVTMLITIYIGKITDAKNKFRILRLGSIIYSLSWFARLMVRGMWSVFFVDAWSRISKNIVVVPLTAITYERAQQKSIMQTIAFFEMSLIIGKLSALIILFILLFIVPDAVVYQTAFILAGIMSLFYMFL